MKLLIFGASGTGTTTLGKALAQQLDWTFLDADDYYWEQTDPPFQKKIELHKRNNNLKSAFEAHNDVIISGSLVTWSTYWNTAFDLAVFLKLPKAIRMRRLLNREIERYGEMLKTNPIISAKSKAFLEWAEKYDAEDFDGRSIRQHKQWMSVMSYAVLELDGDLTPQERQTLVLHKIEQFYS